MGVIYPFREVYAESVKDLTLTPPAGRALMVHDIEVATNTPGWAVIKSGLVTVGFFEIGPAVRNHLQPYWGGYGNVSLLKNAKNKGLFNGYPVSEGDPFVVSCSESVDYIRVIYDENDAGDIKGTEQDGKSADERFCVFYGTNKNEIDASAYTPIDKSLMPSEYKAWPFELDVPPGYSIIVYGLAFLEVEENSYPGSQNAYIRSKRLRIKINREELWHPNEDGFLVLGDGAVDDSKNYAYGLGKNVIPYVGQKYTGNLFWLPDPKELVAGDEVVTEVNYEVDTDAVLDPETIRMAYITKIKKGS